MVNLKESGCESRELTSSFSQIYLVLLEGWSWVQKKYCLFGYCIRVMKLRSSQQFSSSINSNQNLRGVIIQVIPQLVHTSKIDTNLNQLKKIEKKITSISRNLNFHQKKKLQIQLVELPKKKTELVFYRCPLVVMLPGLSTHKGPDIKPKKPS